MIGGWLVGAVPVIPGKPGLWRSAEAAAPPLHRIIVPIAGFGAEGNTGDGGPATLARLSNPEGMAFDAAGGLLIAHRYGIRRVAPDGRISTVAGNGTCGFGGDGGPATEAPLCYVADVAVGSDGSVYIADWGTYRVRKVDPAGVITTVAGNGIRGFAGDGGPATAASFDSPASVAVDSHGNLFISDSHNERIRKVDAAGIVTTYAGTGATGFSGDGGPATAATFMTPIGLALDGSDRLFVADSYNQRIRMIDGSGVITTVAGGGMCCDPRDDGPATSAYIEWPFALAIDSAGQIFVGDAREARVRKIDTTGTISAVAGTGDFVDGGDWGPATAATFLEVNGLAVTSAGALFVADGSAHRVRGIGAKQRPPTGSPLRPAEMFGLNWSELRCWLCAADPVNTATGNFHESVNDLALPGRGPGLSWSRSYNSAVATGAGLPGALGYGWTSNYTMSLVVDPTTGKATVSQESGSQVEFTPAGSGTYTASPRVLAHLVENNDGTFTFTRKKRERFVFSATGRLSQIVDLNGYATTLVYDGTGHLTSAVDSAGRALTFQYNTGGQVASVTDPTGRSVAYTYSAAGDLNAVTDVGGGVSAFVYDTRHRLTSVRAPNGGIVTNTYDETGRVTQQIDPLNRMTTFAYEGDNFTSSEGGATTVTNPNGDITVHRYDYGQLTYKVNAFGTPDEAMTYYEYDPDTLGTTLVVDPNRGETRYTYDSQGNLLTKTDPLGRTVTNTYDSLNNTTSTTDAANVTTTFTYDAAGNMLSASTPLTGSIPAVSRTVSYTYGDPAHPGDVTTVTDARGKTWTKTYSAAGYLASETDPLGNKTTHAHDVAGRLTSTVSARGNVTGGTPALYRTTYTYDAFGHVRTVTDPAGKVTTTTYDANQNVVSTVDANGHETANVYDAADQLVAVRQPDGTVVTRSYDSNGNLVTYRDGAGQSTTYVYDAMNRPVSITDSIQRTTTYDYDSNGNKVGVVDAAGNNRWFVYDRANQLTTAHGGPATPDVSFAYDVLGRRDTMTDGTGTSAYTWDSLGRLTSLTNGAGAAISYGYDLAGNVTSIDYPGTAGTISRTYDDAGRWIGVGDWLGNNTNFGYDPDGNLVSTTYPNGTAVAATYDRTGRTTSIQQGTTAVPPVVQASFGYTRDAVGLVTSLTPTGVPSVAETYTYTPTNQLASVNGNAYRYDLADNLVVKSASSAQTFDTTNQLRSVIGAGPVPAPTTFEYDPRGNRVGVTPLGGSTTRYTYDEVNRLVQVSGPVAAAYSYDGDNLRSAKTVGTATTQFTWDPVGPHPLLLSDDANWYVYGPGGLPTEHISSAGSVYFYGHDALGSTRVLSNAAGAVVGRFGYDAHGAMTSTGSVSTPLTFAGQYRDTETGLMYLRARFYDPATGQFLTRDPKETMTRQPYAYANNNPLNYVDPTGMDWWDPRDWDQTLVSGLQTAGGAVAGAVSGSVDFIWRNRGTIATVAAIGVCLVPAYGLAACGGWAAGAWAARSSQRIERSGFSESLSANLTDALMTYVTFGVGGAFEALAGPWAGVAGRGALQASAALAYLGRLFPAGYDVANLLGWLDEQC